MNETSNARQFLTNRQYDAIKFATIVVLPALGTLYFTLATIWDLPSGKQILGTLLATEAFIGVILGISSKRYQESGAKYDGEINVIKKPGVKKKTYSLDFDGDPEKILEGTTEAIFKVNAP